MDTIDHNVILALDAQPEDAIKDAILPYLGNPAARVVTLYVTPGFYENLRRHQGPGLSLNLYDTNAALAEIVLCVYDSRLAVRIDWSNMNSAQGRLSVVVPPPPPPHA